MWRGLNRSDYFPDFLGNNRIVQMLSQAINNNTIAHTLLFTGPRGAGKKTLARKVVQKLFCPQFCGGCKNCVMLARESHPDYLIISPEGSTIKLEQSRALKGFLSKPPNIALYKVAVVDSCEKLTTEAGNSLLKIMEDPPAQSVCILTADSPDNVLPTLVSRSQVYNLAPLPTAVVEQELLKARVRPDTAKFLAGFSGGILGRALELEGETGFGQQRRNFAVEVYEVMARRRDPLLTAESWQQLPERFLDLLEFWLRDMLRLEVEKDYIPVNLDFKECLAECVAVCPVAKTIFLLEECIQAREYMAARCNPRLVMDSLLLKMWEV